MSAYIQDTVETSDAASETFVQEALSRDFYEFFFRLTVCLNQAAQVRYGAVVVPLRPTRKTGRTVRVISRKRYNPVRNVPATKQPGGIFEYF